MSFPGHSDIIFHLKKNVIACNMILVTRRKLNAAINLLIITMHHNLNSKSYLKIDIERQKAFSAGKVKVMFDSIIKTFNKMFIR